MGWAEETRGALPGSRARSGASVTEGGRALGTMALKGL